jgi:hypothetical protein
VGAAAIDPTQVQRRVGTSPGLDLQRRHVERLASLQRRHQNDSRKRRHVVIGPYNEPATPALGAQLEFRGGVGSDFVRAYDGANLRFRITSAGHVTADGSYTSPAADFAELLPAEPGVGPSAALAALSARP